jgi:hypothetical protein
VAASFGAGNTAIYINGSLDVAGKVGDVTYMQRACMLWGLGSRASSAGSRAMREGLEVRVKGLGSRVKGLGFVGFRVWGVR